MRWMVWLALVVGCSAPQCDKTTLYLWKDGKNPAPYRASVKCSQGEKEVTIHMLRSKTRIKGCQ